VGAHAAVVGVGKGVRNRMVCYVLKSEGIEVTESKIREEGSIM